MASSPDRAVPRAAKWIVLAVVAVVVASVPFVVYKATHHTERYTIGGNLTLTDSKTNFGPECTGVGAYADVTAETKVVVTDDPGTVIGSSTLGGGIGLGHACTFQWSVGDLPKVSVYRIKIGSRSNLRYTFAQIKANDGQVNTGIGS